MRIATLAAFLSLFAAPATAAPITYGMTFFDDAGVNVGTGSLSFDPTVKEEIWLRTIDGSRCDGPVDPFGLECTLQAVWTPLVANADILGVPFNIGQFLEGSLIPPNRCQCGHVEPGIWTRFDDTAGDGIWIGAISDFSLATFFFAVATNFLPNDAIGGTVAFDRVSAIPLPAAALLFPVGLTGLTFANRRRRRS